MNVFEAIAKATNLEDKKVSEIVCHFPSARVKFCEM